MINPDAPHKSPQHAQPAVKTTGAWVGRALWALMALICLVFAPTAAEFYWVNASHGTATYAQLLALVVSDSYAYGPESGFAIMTPYWRNMPEFNKVVLGIHALLASVVLAIGPFLFSRTVRRRWPSSHRYLGRTYVALGVVSMLLAMLYLSLTPMTNIYGGAPFAIGLWGIAVLTLYTLIVGAWHIIRDEIHEHRAVMILNFSAMLIAPLLRIWWAALGRWFSDDPSIMQEETHVAVLMFLGLETMVGAIVVVTLLNWDKQHRPTSRAISRLRQWTYTAIPKASLFTSLAGGLAALLTINQTVLRFLGSPDLFASSRPLAVKIAEQALFEANPTLAVLEALTIAGLLVFAPRVLKTLFLSHAPKSHRIHLLTFSALTLTSATLWLLKADALGRDGVAGWGSAVFWGALAFATFSLLTLWAVALRQGAVRQLRELTLHLYALSLSPLLLTIMQASFLGFGFTWTDAFLSAAVASTSIALSGSYYYTVYSGAPSNLHRLQLKPRAS